MMDENIQSKTNIEAIPWNIWDIAKAALVAVLITIVLGIILVIAMILLVDTKTLQDIAAQHLSSTDTLKAIVDTLKANGRLNIMLGVLFIFMVLGEGAIPLGTWLFSIRKYKCGWEALGFRKFDIKKGLLLSLAVTAVGIGISIGYEALLQALGWRTSSDLYLPFNANGVGIAFFFVIAAIVAPLAEETFFRGFLFQGVRKRLNFAWATIISAAIFAIGHFSPSGLVPIFILGLMLAWLFNTMKSIWPCIIVHCAYNSIALIFMIIS